MSAFEDQVGGEHYRKLKIQPAEYCFANNIGHLAGDAIAYITRYKFKNGLEDLRKAIHSLQLLIELEDAEVVKDAIDLKKPMKRFHTDVAQDITTECTYDPKHHPYDQILRGNPRT